MRLFPLVLILGVAASTVSAPVLGQRADDQIRPQSVALLKQGEAALAQGKFDEADDALEAALVADPKNRKAFVAMARVAMAQKLYGQAIRFTNRALQMEPGDREALQIQGQAMVEAGATARAKDVLAKLTKVCAGPCREASLLGATIERGPSLASADTKTEARKN